MNEKTLLKVALIISLVGILIILFVTENLEYPLTNISDITKYKIDEKIKIEGTISSFRSAENVSFITLQDDTGSILVIVFEEVQLKQNQKAGVIGTVAEYEKELEILAEEIIIK